VGMWVVVDDGARRARQEMKLRVEGEKRRSAALVGGGDSL